MRLRAVAFVCFSVVTISALPAVAAEEDLELWFNPAVEADLDDRTSVELETAQRFREAPAADTFYARLWLNRELADGVKGGVGIERRDEGPTEETRLLQQLSYGVGPIDLRTRMEQRFLSSDPRTAWRLRQRVGISAPLSSDGAGWTAVANAEGFFTLRAARPGGQEGLTGLRTFVGVEREFGRWEVSLGYLRQQTIRRNAPDRIGHAPFVGLTLSL